METRKIENGSKGQLVTFRLGNETYGIDIFKIQEVLHFQRITTIPNAPEFMEGVIDLRDRVIPVVDLKKRLNVKEKKNGRQRIVVLDLERPFGVIVDDISKVLMLDASQYEVLPEAVMSDRDTNCITKLAKADDELIIVISPEQILSRRENDVLKNFEESNGEESIDDDSSNGAS